MLLKKLGKYEIIEWLGGGRFGDVFLARDTILEKNFALKISRMRKEEIMMLKDEARLLASLDHPHIVRFYNIDFIENKFVLIMEYIEGKILRDFMKDGGIDIKQAISITIQVLDAVDYAHRNSVLHRDLKPENILIAEKQDKQFVKIADFGLARFIKSGSISASTAGTPVYMAPETWSGKFSEKSDIWSVGIILYELLTGVPPFLADNLDSLRRQIEGNQLLIPRILRPDIPEYIEDAITGCLCLNPDSRPRAGELSEKLARQPKKLKVKTGLILPEKSTPTINLTPSQIEVINAINGKILLLGQAGCGKTMTLTYAVVKLIENAIPISNILVATFTNKAANDIKERLRKLVGFPLDELWLGTIHTVGLRILRRHAERIDFSEDFVIREPKSVLQEMKIKAGKYRIAAIIKYIELLRARAITPNEFKPKNDWESLCLEIYKKYQHYKMEHNILDYEDLIIYAIKLFEENGDLKDYYQNLFDYVFVDELQDISPVQYKLISLLSKNNIFFTGDEDQAIYGWRGADRELIYRVAKDYDDIKTFYLSKSFRLAQSILEIANNLMHRAVTAIPAGQIGDVLVYAAKSEADEADYVAAEIEQLKKEDFQFQEIAVLYRMNYISRIYEETFVKAQIPHTLIGGASFYERADVKPLIEYLELLESGLTKNINKEFVSRSTDLLKIEAQNLDRAHHIFEYHQKNTSLLSPLTIIENILNLGNFQGENIEELKSLAHGYATASLSKFLNEIRLIQELDLVDWGKDTVKLMTMHSAKGLEFPVIFLVDLTEDIFPLTKKMSAQKDLQEERRLCYVALTRAQRKLYLLYPKWRCGRYQKPSRFLVDMFKTQI